MSLFTTGLRLAADSAIDLHLHTTYSDGRWTLEPLLEYLLREQFALAALVGGAAVLGLLSATVVIIER
jgi:predicted metal-dependent phosphoesterase TrpH